MSPSRIALLAVTAIALLAPSVPAQQTRPAEASRNPTSAPTTRPRIERKTYRFEAVDKEMEYALFVPSGYDKARKAPLIVALHGLYSSPQQIMRYPGLTDLAERHGYIVVAPMGYNSRGWYGATPLVRGREGDPPNLGELSERDVMNVLDLVRTAYHVDPDRTYLLGHSMGGGGTWHLAIKHPDLWAALAPIAPATLRPPTDLEKIKHVPVILVQGDSDVLVRPERVRPWAEQMKRLGMTHEYVEVRGGDHITVAFTTLPKIFEFFNAHPRRSTAQDNGKGK